MVGPLILIGVIVLLVGGPLLWVLWASKRRPGQTDLVLLAAAAGEAELELWKQTLGRHAIRCHIVSLSTPTLRAVAAGPYAYELWVRPDDVERAREALAL